MSAYEPQVGHRVRMTRVVEDVVIAAGASFVKMADRTWTIDPLNQTVTFERLPDPEPEWQPGDVVMDAVGDVYKFDPSGPYVWRYGERSVYPDTPSRPLRRLVPEDPA